MDETSYKNNGFFKTPSKTDSINFYNLPFGSTERMAMIGDKAKKVGSKFITHKKDITHEKMNKGIPSYIMDGLQLSISKLDSEESKKILQESSLKSVQDELLSENQSFLKMTEDLTINL